jgi:hypothetical protein
LLPGCTLAGQKFYFDLLDRDANQQLDVFDFLDLREVLQLHIEPVLKKVDHNKDSWFDRIAFVAVLLIL